MILFWMKCVLLLSSCSFAAGQIPQTSFNHRLDGFVFRRLFKISYGTCREECGLRANCLSVNYERLSQLCELNYEKHITKRNAFLNRALGFIYSAKLTWKLSSADSILSGCGECKPFQKCQQNSFTGVHTQACEYEECPIPKFESFLGNVNAVSNKLKIFCADKVTEEAIVCQNNGSWSTVTEWCLYGKCWPPPSTENSTVKLTSHGSVVTAVYKCKLEYMVYRGPNHLTCDALVGFWANATSTCCDIPVDGQWRKIHRIATGGDVLIKKIWEGRYNGLHGKCQFSDTDIIENWVERNITEVRVDIKKKGEVVAWITFDANRTDNKNWFSQEKLLNSSYSDLVHAQPVQAFSFINHKEQFRRWYISEAVGINGTCEGERAWMLVTWRYMPCGMTKIPQGPIIFYAKGNNVSEWNVKQTGIADVLEVSVKFLDLQK